MEERELFDRIESYLKKELSPQEVIIFEKEIVDNPELAQAVALQRLEWDAMEVIIENDLRQNMSKWDNPISATPSPKESLRTVSKHKMGINETSPKGLSRSQLYWLSGTAASLLIATFATVWYFNKPQVPTTEIVKTESTIKMDTPSVSTPSQAIENEKNTIIVGKDKQIPQNELQNRNFEAEKAYLAYAESAYFKSDLPQFEDMQASRGEAKDANNVDDAGKAYDKKDFKKAIDLLKNTPAKDEYFMALEILAHAYFQTKNYPSALPVFKNLLKLSGKKSHDKSEWYLLLCYLTDFKMYQAEFKALENKILSNKEHDYYTQTMELHERLNKK
jgi:hypothetical protein